MIDELKTLLQRYRIRFLGPATKPLASAWSWWIGELFLLLPESTRQSIVQARKNTYLQLSENDVVIYRGTPECMQETGRCPLAATTPVTDDLLADGRDIVLLLPPEKTLKKTITLPAATEENLREVLAFDMDQQTPFSADQVYFDYAISSRSSKNKSIDVDLLLAPRRIVNDLLKSLATLDLRPDIVSAMSGSSSMFDLNLLSKADRPRKTFTVQKLNFVLAVLLLALTITALAIPILQKQRTLNSLQLEVAAAIEASATSAKLRRDIERLTLGSKRLLAMKSSQPMILSILDDMTRVVPDSTWISRLDVRAGEIQIQGQSSNAASLIGAIDASPYFSDPQFRSPLTQVPRSELERFHLAATLTEVAP